MWVGLEEIKSRLNVCLFIYFGCESDGIPIVFITLLKKKKKKRKTKIFLLPSNSMLLWLYSLGYDSGIDWLDMYSTQLCHPVCLPSYCAILRWILLSSIFI